MSNNIKGLTIKIAGETTALDKSLAGVNKSAGSLQSELREVNKLLKVDPSGTEILEQKQKLLAASVENTKNKLEILKEAAAQAKEKLEIGEISEEQYRALEREVVKTEQSLVNLSNQQMQASGIMTQAEIETAELAKAMEEAEQAAREKAEADEKAAQEAEKLADATAKVDEKIALEQATLEANTSALDENKDSLKILQTQRESLNKQIDLQKQKVGSLEAEIENLTSAENRNEKAIMDKRTQLANAKTDLNNYQKELKAVGTELDLMAKNLQKTGSDMQKIGGTMSKYVTVPLTAAGGAAYKMAADMDDAMGATDQVFKSQSKEMQNWADSLESYYGIAENEALEYANIMGSMLKNIGGLTEKEAADTSKTFIKLGGDLAAMFGGSTADAVRALTGSMKGNNSMLDNYGMAINETVIKNKALQMGLIKTTGEMSLQAKQAATLQLIMEQTTDAQGQAAREAEGASGVMRSFATELKNLSIAIGQVLLPIITPLISALTTLMGFIGDLPPAIQGVIVVIGLLLAAVGPVLLVVGFFIEKIGLIIQVWPAILTGIQALGTAFLALNPIIMIIVGVITLLVVAITYLWETNENFRDGVIAIWTTIKDAAIASFSAIVDFFKVTIPNALNSLLDAFKNIPANIKKYLEQAKEKLEEWAEDIQKWAKTKLKEKAEEVAEAFKSLPDNLKEIGVNMMEGLWDGIQSKIQSVKDKVSGAVDSIKSVFTGKKGFDTHSPSLWATEVGDNVGEGLDNGLTSKLKGMLGGIKKSVSTIKNTFNDGLDFAYAVSQKTKPTPIPLKTRNINKQEANVTEKTDGELAYLLKELITTVKDLKDKVEKLPDRQLMLARE